MNRSSARYVRARPALQAMGPTRVEASFDAANHRQHGSSQLAPETVSEL